ncbi:hypothetical protein WICPIJ_008623 [Wickerhamomyces pijperi]|uniref:Uncharacterized protein n=1 Tax=Wickerhamomyces pijperi TaxID=599730 RepID=A0A9P8PXI0_WICPI|nr:hypothetical protein WICPIJ_008623 [Wickerhamomyces pijperi]
MSELLEKQFLVNNVTEQQERSHGISLEATVEHAGPLLNTTTTQDTDAMTTNGAEQIEDSLESKTQIEGVELDLLEYSDDEDDHSEWEGEQVEDITHLVRTAAAAESSVTETELNEQEEHPEPPATEDYEEIDLLDSEEGEEEGDQPAAKDNSESNPILIEDETPELLSSDSDSDSDHLETSPLRIPIILETNNFPYLLTPIPDEMMASLPSEFEHAITLFEDVGDNINGLTLYEVFQYIRETFKDYGNPFSEDEELVLHFKEFDLTLVESDAAAYKVILKEVIEAFISLQDYLGVDNAPQCLCLELTSQKSFIQELDKLRTLGERRESALVDVPALSKLSNIELDQVNTLKDQKVDNADTVEAEYELLEEIDDREDEIEELGDIESVEQSISIPQSSEGEDAQTPSKPTVNPTERVTETCVEAEADEDDLLEYINSPVPTQQLDSLLANSQSSNTLPSSSSNGESDVQVTTTNATTSSKRNLDVLGSEDGQESQAESDDLVVVESEPKRLKL